MKKITFIVLLIVSLSSVYAQTADLYRADGTEEVEITKDKKHRHLVKFNLTNLIINHYYLNYEFAILKFLSVDVGYGMIPKSRIPYIKDFVEEPAVTEDTYEMVRALYDTKLAGKIFNASIKLYLGKDWSQGFYFEPYYRLEKYDVSDFHLEVDDDIDLAGFQHSEDGIKIDMSGDMTSNSFGLLLGTQWFIGKKKHFLIDVWWLSLHYGSVTATVEGRSNASLTDEQLTDVQNNFDNMDLENDYVEFETEIHKDNAKIKVKGPWAGIRCGLSIGYRF